MDKILEALGATDEAHALRIIAEFKSAATSLHSLTGRETFALQLPVMQARCTFVAAVEAKTGKTGQDSVLGVLEVWKESHDSATKTAADLAAAQVELENLKFDRAISEAKTAGKLTKAGEDKYRELFTSKKLALVGIQTALELTEPNPALVNARLLTPPAAPAAVAGGTPAFDSTKKFEDYTVDEMATAREYGQVDADQYKVLRKDWEGRGKPALKQKPSASAAA